LAKIAIDMGHCPKSPGASGYLDELAEDRRIGREVIGILRARGHEVVDVTPGDGEAEYLTGRAQRANKAGVDLFVSIHLNAGGGTGAEVWTTAGSAARGMAPRLSAAVASCLGIRDRGHKTANFTVLAKTNAPAMLLETCFVDSEADRDAYNASTPAKIAEAICAALVGGGAAPAPNQPTAPTGAIDTVIEVQHWLNVEYGAGIAEDDQPGRASKRACVRAAQKACGATVDGDFAAKSGKAWGGVSRGDAGEKVACVQAMLLLRGYPVGKCGVDRSFGADTEAAWRAFQRDHCRAVDGICGVNDSQVLFTW
jgi:peptidoglycan hydrolase-like protein with peptidoglycan-binding domain